MKFGYSLLLACLFVVFGVLAAMGQGYSRLLIDLSNETDAQRVGNLGLALDHVHHPTPQTLVGEFSTWEKEQLIAAAIPFTVLIEDLEAMYRQQIQTPTLKGQLHTAPCELTADYSPPQHWSLGSMGGYFTYQEVLAHLDSMRARYPNLISARQVVSNQHLSHEGRELFYVRVSDNPDTMETEPQVLYTAIHHAREPMSIAQLIYFLWWALERYATDPDVAYLLDNTELYIVPFVNPDGYIYNQTQSPNGGGMWRKNRRDNGDGTFGVDLNRNYGYQWGQVGASPNTWSETYRGVAPFSEPETRAIRDFCIAHEFILALNYHSFGDVLITPFGYSLNPPPDEAIFQALNEDANRDNRYRSGNALYTVGYQTSGSSDDWMYGEEVIKNKSFSVTPEVGPADWAFWPPSSAIEALCQGQVRQNMLYAYSVLPYAIVEDLSPVAIENNQWQFKYSLKNNSLGIGNYDFSVQPIANGNVFSTSTATININSQGRITDSLSLSLPLGLSAGDTVLLALALDNGSHVFRDTLTKIWGIADVVFFDDCSTLQNWTPTGYWGLGANAFSLPTSITDSPQGFYDPFSSSTITLNSPINLKDTMIVRATLSFQGSWDLERYLASVQVQASMDGINFSPLCMTNSLPSSYYQAVDFYQPMYDDEHSLWTLEEADLTDYLGSEVWLRFSFVANSSNIFDGFSFDDLAVKVWREEVIIADMPNTISTQAKMSIQPNPTAVSIVVQVEQPLTNARYQLGIFDASGRLLSMQHISSSSSSVEVAGLAAGSYQVVLFSNGRQYATQKLIKQ